VWKLALLWALVLAAYSNSFDAGFVYDNESAILQDARVHEANLHNVRRILTESYWADQPNTGLYRPVTTLSYLVNYAIFGNGTNPVGYHWVNLILHAINVSLVYTLGILILGDPALALTLAAIWGLHPLLTEAVTNIIGRADLLAALGVLTGLFCHIRAKSAGGWRKVGWLIGLAFSQTIALFSKENGVVLPALMLSYELIWRERSSWLRRILPYAVLVIPLIAFFTLRSQLHMHLEVPFRSNPLVGAPFWPARMTAVKVIGKFLWLYIWPARLSADYSYNSVPLFQWAFAWQDMQAPMALALCIVMIGFAVRLRRENRPFCFFVLLFFIALAPTSNFFILIGSTMSERFLYLPAIGLTGCVVSMICAQRVPRKALWAVTGILCFALGVRTYARNFDWHDEASLWRSVIEVNPDDALAHLNLGSALLEIPSRMPDAIAEYQTAVRIYPNYADAHNNLGAILLQSGRVNEAVAEYRAAVRLDPDYPDAHSNLGSALSRIPGRLPEAIAELETAVRLDPENGRRRAALGNVLLQTPGRIFEAIGQLEAAVKIDPDDAGSHYQLGLALSRIPGKLPEAIAEIETAARLRPDPRLQELLERLRHSL
jgi:protein O-mannosyl-transferase